jgi:hypothetical protein
MDFKTLSKNNPGSHLVVKQADIRTGFYYTFSDLIKKTQSKKTIKDFTFNSIQRYSTKALPYSTSLSPLPPAP